MKKALSFAFILSGLIFLASCTEKGPYIHYGSFNDTTYLATTETAQSRNLLIEEFTGVTCPNCPRGHRQIAAIENSNPGTVAIGYYSFNQPQAQPSKAPDPVSKQDFRTQDATNMDNNVLHPAQLPTGIVDRLQMEDPPLWTNDVTTELAKPTKANILLTSNFDTVSKKLSLKVRVAFTSTVNDKVYLSAGIVENNIIDIQEDASAPPPFFDTFYVHNHVLRTLLTSSPTGDALLSYLTNIESGRVYERTFTYTIPSSATIWNLKNCRVYAFVHTQTIPGQVLQAADTSLIGH